jgi:hypothetical protein
MIDQEILVTTNSAAHRFEYEGWNVLVELDASTLDGVISGHADLHWKDGHRCRIALAGKHEDGASAIASLSRLRADIDSRLSISRVRRPNGAERRALIMLP